MSDVDEALVEEREEVEVWMPNPLVPQWKREATWEVAYDVPRRRRTVRTWRAPDGTVTTQVSPWLEVTP